MADPDLTPVFVITHIDIIPTNMQAGRELLLGYAADIRDEAGLTRFELLRQLHQPNHFETLAVWESETHYVESLGAPVTLRTGSVCTRSSGHRSMTAFTFSKMNRPLVAKRYLVNEAG
jgi:quinol monooxygenase YgiN